MRAATNPRVGERGRLSGCALCSSDRYDDSDVRDAVPDVGQADVAVVLDVHLATITHPVDTHEMAHEGESSLRAMSSREIQATTYDRAEAVGTDDEIGMHHPCVAGVVQHFHAGHPSSGIE